MQDGTLYEYTNVLGSQSPSDLTQQYMVGTYRVVANSGFDGTTFAKGSVNQQVNAALYEPANIGKYADNYQPKKGAGILNIASKFSGASRHQSKSQGEAVPFQERKRKGATGFVSDPREGIIGRGEAQKTEKPKIDPKKGALGFVN